MTTALKYIVVNQTPNYLCSDILSAITRKHPDLQLELWHGLTHASGFRVTETVVERIGPAYKNVSLVARFWSWIRFTYWVSGRIYENRQENTRYLFFSNPPTLVFLKSIADLQFNYAVYDLYPDALHRLRIDCLLLPFIAAWKRKTATAFRRARIIFVLGEHMAARVLPYLPPTHYDKVRVVPLWPERAVLQEASDLATHFKREWKLANRKVILYAGNLGQSQPCAAFIEIARVLADSRDWVVVIVGGGSHARLVEQQTSCFSNVVFCPPVRQEHFGAVLAIADWGLVVLSEASGTTSVPSKAYNLLAAGVPLLAMVPEASETARLIDADGVGLRFSEQDLPRVLSTVTSMSKADRDAFSQRALQTAKRYTSALAEEFVPPLPEDEGRPRGI